MRAGGCVRMNNNHQHQNNGTGDALSWAIVIISLLVFWPLGLFLLIRKFRFNGKSFRFFDENENSNATPGTGRTSSSEYSQTSAQRDYYAPGQQRQSAAGSSNGSYYTGSTSNVSKKQRNKNKKNDPNQHLKNAGKGPAVALTLLAALLGVAGIILLSSGLSTLAVSGLAVGTLSMIIIGGFCLLGGILSFITRGSVLRRARRFYRYAIVVGERRVVPVGDIARTVGETDGRVRRTLETMIDSGYFGPEAYFDSELYSLVLSAADAEKAKAAQKSDAAVENAQVDGSAYVAVVSELHLLCGRTSDPAICAKIERIKDLTVKIFKIVEEHPEKKPQLKRFMSYYLPTTLKLLRSYETLEKQGVSGRNITAAKQDIERILDTLAAGFEQQLDRLFMSDKLDISSDIDVLENLMERDGLTDGGILRTSSGNG